MARARSGAVFTESDVARAAARAPMNASWLAQFHEGHNAALSSCYTEHFETVRKAVGRVLQGADRDTVVHQVFFRLVSEPTLRQHFQGGNFPAWITRVARNEAIDFRRHYDRGKQLLPDPDTEMAPAPSLGNVDAKLLVEQFKERLPKKLQMVFDARFVRQLSQREAADELGIQRTTLVYQEQQVRESLRAFLIEDE
jgi:RNA polymerase sigma-70 factor (ECF subfamily)